MNVAIIGAGALGLLASDLLTKNKINHTIFNAGKIGNKILASGNGRCNISNISSDPANYHNNRFSKIVLENQRKLFDYFKELKIYTKTDDEGRMYPISESSLSVLNVLLKNSNAKIIELEVERIDIRRDKYYINEFGPFDAVIIACGSSANYKNKNSFGFIKRLNIRMNEFRPSLTGFKVSKNIKAMSGARAKVNSKLYNDGKLIHEEKGEVIFKDDGISGIVIMNQSSYYNNLKNVDPYIELDLVNDDYDDLSTVLNPKILDYVSKNRINPRKMILPITGTYSLEFSQVAKGGIDLSELNDNLSLKKYKNMYAGGEIIDCDGLCGGFNLMFAFTSAIKIVEEILK